jgi:hypothetical protein
MLDRCRFALKEWAVIVRELGEGRQIALIRKGGILEQKHGFTIEHREFFLFPTYTHQNENDLAPSLHPRFAELLHAGPEHGRLLFDYYAVAEEIFQVAALDPLIALEDMHGFSWSAVERRFQYRRPGLYVLALRVYKLPRTLLLPASPHYEGCLSWVDLDEELLTEGAAPVLTDTEFSIRLDRIRAVLGPVHVEPPSTESR